MNVKPTMAHGHRSSQDMVLRQDTASYSKSLKVQDSQLPVAQNFSSLRVKPGIPVPVMLLPVPIEREFVTTGFNIRKYS